MTIDLSVLKTEFKNDPQSMGYSTKLQKANDQAVADLLNSLTGPGASAILRNDIRSDEIINAIDATEFASLTALQISQLELFLTLGVLDATKVNTITIFKNIFKSMPNTMTNIAGVIQRIGSRAEVLFGAGVVITMEQIGASR